MNSTPALTFKSKVFDIVDRDGQPWFTLSDIADVLYGQGGALNATLLEKRGCRSDTPFENRIRKLFSRHADEFSDKMTALVEKMTAGGKQMVRIFSLRGAHLLAMFARTPVAKEFRAWVLDILDREVANLRPQAPNSRLDEHTLRDIEGLCTHAEFLRSWWERFGPGVRALNQQVAANVHDQFTHAAMSSRSIVRALGLLSNREYAARYPWEAGHLEKQAYHLRAEGHA